MFRMYQHSPLACTVTCLAEAVVQSLLLTSAENRAFALASVEGDGPGQDTAQWDKLFTACYPSAAQKKASVTV